MIPKEQHMEAKKFLKSILSSITLCLLACSNLQKSQIEDYYFDYQIYDLYYEGVLYVGVHNPNHKWEDDPQDRIYPIESVKLYYEQYGIDTLLHNFCGWYYSQEQLTEQSQWNIQDAVYVPWSNELQQYIIYLALRNGYRVLHDCESGYLLFWNQSKQEI